MHFHGDHTSSLRCNQGARLDGVCPWHFIPDNGPHVRTQHCVTASAGQRRGDVEIRNYLRDQAGSRRLVFDLSITHNRYESSSHPLHNGRLTHPQDIDAPLHIAAQRKINSYRQQYADNQNISFLPTILSTSTRMHGEFLRLLFLQAHRETEAHEAHCHRNTTNRTRSVSSARHSPVAEEQPESAAAYTQRHTDRQRNRQTDRCSDRRTHTHADTRTQSSLLEHQGIRTDQLS
jgi:hypothetical protein